MTELNLSCPNVPGKPQIAYDFETTETILREVFTYFTKPLGIKLPPYFDIVHFDQADFQPVSVEVCQLCQFDWKWSLHQG